MKTELLTVSKIFTESLYRIPDYQRGYSWGLEQLKDFWLDLEQLQNDSRHYIGVLTLEEVPESKWCKWEDDVWIIKSRHFKPYYVVDGQQRLTTIIILLQALTEREHPKYLNFNEIKDVRKKYIYDSKPEEDSRSYIFGYEKDNPSYEFLKKNILLGQSNIHYPNEDTIYTKNLYVAKSFFLEKLSSLEDDKIDNIFTKVTQQLVFNAYEIASDIDVFVTFETMNNRGKPLTTLELLKNRLIFLSTKLPTPDGEENRLRKTINESWKEAYHFLGKNENRLISDDDFLSTYLAYYYLTKIEKIPNTDDEETNRKKRIFERNIEYFNRFLLNELFSQKRIYQDQKEDKKLPKITREFIADFSNQLKKSVELYYQLNSPFDSKYTDDEKVVLEQLGRLRNYNPSCILFSVYQIEKVKLKRISFIKTFERYSFLSSLSGTPHYISRRRYRHDNTIEYSSGNITTDQLIEQYNENIENTLKESSIADLLHDWVKNGEGYYTWRFIRYFLFEYELFLQSGSKTERDKIDWTIFVKENYETEYMTIEHIYPQRARDKYWTDRFSKFTPSQKKMLRNSLGNLLALSKPKNSSLSNKPFPEKRDSETTGYRFGSYSENQVALYEEWTAEIILERGLKMLEFLENRWSFSIGDKEQKIKALGLSFLVEQKKTV